MHAMEKLAWVDDQVTLAGTGTKVDARVKPATRMAPPKADSERCMVWNLNVWAT